MLLLARVLVYIAIKILSNIVLAKKYESPTLSRSVQDKSTFFIIIQAHIIIFYYIYSGIKTAPNLEAQGTRHDPQFLLHIHGTGIIF
jgi:hypothetical protein